LAETTWVVTFKIDDVSVPAVSVADLFDGDPALKTITIALACGAVVIVFVDGPNSINFDFNLNEILCQQDLDELLEFVRLVGQQTKRSVRLLYEGSHHSFGGYLHETDNFYLIGYQ
jgi:hypothetical protein